MKHQRLCHATLLTGAFATAGGVNHPTSAGPLGRQQPCTAIARCSCPSYAFVTTPCSPTPTASFWPRCASKTIKNACSQQSHKRNCPKRSWAVVSAAASASNVSAMTAFSSSAAYPARTHGRQSRVVQRRGWGVMPAVSRFERVPGTLSAAGDDGCSTSGSGTGGGVGTSDAEREGDKMDTSEVGEKEGQENRWIRRLDVAVRVTCCAASVMLC